MRRSLDSALAVAALSLLFAGKVASEEITQKLVESAPDSARFEVICENLMTQVLQDTSVSFARSSVEIGTSSVPMLDEVVEIAFDCPSLVIAVTGHTDNRGNETINRTISKARAESVVAYLTDRGINSDRLSANGVGSDAPIASNDNRTGRQVNRRIEFELGTREIKKGRAPFTL